MSECVTWKVFHSFGLEIVPIPGGFTAQGPVSSVPWWWRAHCEQVTDWTCRNEIEARVASELLKKRKEGPLGHPKLFLSAEPSMGCLALISPKCFLL